MRPTPRTRNRLLTVLALAALGLGGAATARAQLPTSEERLKILTDPESVKKKLEKDKSRPPLEMFRSQVAPFDVLPYVKPNHWSTLSLEMRANYEDYAGLLQTAPVRLVGSGLDRPQEIVFQRDARLIKAQRSRLGLQILLPVIPKEVSLELLRPDAIRADEVWPASLRTLEVDQMLVLFLTKEPNDAYAAWNRYQALLPLQVERGDVQAMDRARYYRLVLPLEPDKPPVSPHPLTWTTISHVVWDGMPPDNLNPSQQQALLDWLHWGGQLVLIGGAGPSFSVLKDSFLSPYLPAEPTGDNALLSRDGLKPLADAYPPPLISVSRDADEQPGGASGYNGQRLNDRYRVPAPITPAPNRPVFLAGLKPNPGSTVIPLGDSGGRPVGVEQRVGRGRVLMLAMNPTDPALATWPGLDTFVRRVVLRRPEESRFRPTRLTSRVADFAHYTALGGSDLSWVRYLGRDIDFPLPKAERGELTKVPRDAGEPPGGGVGTPVVTDPAREESLLDPDYHPPNVAVAAWNDGSSLARLCRDELEEASGIKIPNSTFVLKVVLAYILALVPLNWLVCRYLVGRRELAWVVVPTLALGFAIAVERAAAYDMGYNSACDEVDVVEAYGGYPRAHVSRFASLYSTGRTRYTISYPNDPTALALPLDTGRSLRGEDVVTSVWRSYPVPALEGFLVQPRSLGMFRAEQMAGLDGSVSLVSDGRARRVVNDAGFELRDAVLVDLAGPKQRRETYLGTIAAGATVEVKEAARPERTGLADPFDPERFLAPFRAYYEDRPENQGEIRLVAWAPRPLGGQKIEPGVDRHRGFTAVVIHLRNGPPPSPDAPRYDALAKGAEPAPDLAPVPDAVSTRTRRGPTGPPMMTPPLRVMPGGPRGRLRPTPPPPTRRAR